MILLSLHCRNSEALRCSVLQTGSVVYGSLSITSFESVINQSELCVQILDACLTHARKHQRDPCRLSFTQTACSQANIYANNGHISEIYFYRPPYLVQKSVDMFSYINTCRLLTVHRLAIKLLVS